MARNVTRSTARTEQCEKCDGETAHDVSVELRTESDASENAQFSREPYRVSVCQNCGTADIRRMNDA